MKITKCRTVFLTYEYTDQERWTWSGGVAYGQTACLVVVETDAGLYGLGEINAGPQAPGVVTAAVEALEPHLLGEDPWNVEYLWRKMYKASIVWGRRGVALGVIGGIETALWDLLGKAVEKPVYQLIGGLIHPKIRAYASGGVRHEAGVFEDEMKRYVDEGFTAVKIRIGFPSCDENLRITERARKALGDEIDLMLDAGQGYVPRAWSVPEAIRIARRLEAFSPFWLEEPYLTDEPEGYAEVRRATVIPIAGGENGVTKWEFKGLLDSGAVDILQPDASVAGGILECRRISEMAAQRSVPVAHHIWGSSVSVAANLHCMAATPNALIAEYPCIPNPLRDALFVEPLKVEEGYIQVPQLPGLGVHLTEEVLERFRPRGGIRTQILSQYGEA